MESVGHRDSESLHTLVKALCDPACYSHPVQAIELLETHISYVILTGPFAYKIKKPVDLQFLDFSTLEKRRHYCHEEVRLNRRLAPQLYLDVVPITGSVDAPVLGGSESAIEYAVRMRQFPQGVLLDRLLAQGAVLPTHIDDLARQIAEFHARTAVADTTSPFGTPELVYQPAQENFRQIGERIRTPADRAALAQLQAWTEREYAARLQDFRQRKERGFIRECHGDMHAGNMVLLDDRITVFDCIEFNENLRWIDVMNEVAFLVMDLADRGRPDLAHRFLNAYLESTGDYAGLRVLRYYLVYRALVRAKVAAIRLQQEGIDADSREHIWAQFHGYLRLARRYTEALAPLLAITCGLSGSGKTTITQSLLESLGAIRLRSDVVRKTLFGLAPEARSGSGLASSLYSSDASIRTYQTLAQHAHTVVSAGYSAILDATFLKRAQRDSIRQLAADLGVVFRILYFTAPEGMLRARILQRAAKARDASEANIAVLENQIRNIEPLAPDEIPFAIMIASDQPMEIARIVEVLRRITPHVS